ncbi:flagellar hook-length control protein FliK [Afifella sp. IM 167]|uniref:flagellar hook-length control protein FliK n=1 Tax=Afifella sp. IM 167 TaxID=2033586 RepID=UPI001CCA4D22|nr:flagellar hook-length control protein FliK [Afifella sp. IM 167]MBZ8131770.1 hypothetical protein [Afifella sp. IM 167]
MNNIDFITAKAMPRTERGRTGTLAGEDPTAENGARGDFMKLLQEMPGRLGGPEPRRGAGSAKAGGEAEEARDARDPVETGDAGTDGTAEDAVMSAADILALAGAAGSAEGVGGEKAGAVKGVLDRGAAIRLPGAQDAAAMGDGAGEGETDAGEEAMRRSPLRFTVTDRKTHFAPTWQTGRLSGAEAAQNAAPVGALSENAGADDDGLKLTLAGEASHELSPKVEGGNRAATTKAADMAQAPLAVEGARETAGAQGGQAGEREPGRDRTAAKSSAAANAGEMRAADAGVVRESAADSSEPSLPPAQLNRIASAIASESRAAGEVPASQRGLSPAVAVAAQTGAAGPVKTLTIQLHPADLGSVKIQLRLGGDALSVRLEASRAETARMLQRDSQALSDLLKGAGQDGDNIVVHSVTVDRGVQGADSSQFLSARGAAQPQTDTGAGAAGGGGRQGSSRQEEGQGQRSYSQEARDGTTSPDSRTRSGLFV